MSSPADYRHTLHYSYEPCLPLAPNWTHCYSTETSGPTSYLELSWSCELLVPQRSMRDLVTNQQDACILQQDSLGPLTYPSPAWIAWTLSRVVSSCPSLPKGPNSMACLSSWCLYSSSSPSSSTLSGPPLMICLRLSHCSQTSTAKTTPTTTPSS